ncbi:MAG TPA: nucleoside triphosphate pyrophosphohydrolase [Candidatus Dojkabacteria bacterium]|jgi:predicted house-cleaning noncanonical NTP pyrophosphatase (MazG superfamily)
MKSVIFNKLVRDKVTDELKRHTTKIDSETLSDERLITAIKNKILEEAAEISEANLSKITEEIADLEEIISKLKQELSITESQIEDIRKRKRKKSGGFEKNIFIHKVEVGENSELLKYVKGKRDKYKVI